MTRYTPTIGLEIHAELKTRTKMFCGSKNDPDEKAPNVNICPVCMGHPGTLPVINKEAVKAVIKTGTAVGGTIADFTEFDRKNYFYPDIPKGYQISQYKYPLVVGGTLAGVSITRIHLEEDTAKSAHESGTHSLVDFNRAGVPLMELVTEPVIHSAEEAAAFARELQLLLQYLDVAAANMEKGEMRVEANISVSSSDSLGTKVEIKNLNSFRSVERAIAYEVDRHIGLLEKGEKITQETRGWDEQKEVTFLQRRKENSHDYRYFPDPDLPKLWISKIPELSREAIAREIPELPWEKRKRYRDEFALRDEEIEIYTRSLVWGNFFELVVKKLHSKDPAAIRLASNYILSDLTALVKRDMDNLGIELINLAEKMPAENFAALIALVSDGTLSSRGAKDVLTAMYQNGKDPKEIAETLGVLQQSDQAVLLKVVQRIIEVNEVVVKEYKGGKESVLQFLIGQAMKETKGSANPALLKDLFITQMSIS